LERLAAALKKLRPEQRVIDALMIARFGLSRRDDAKLFARLIGKVTAANVARRVAVLERPRRRRPRPRRVREGREGATGSTWQT
jgi:hypothetical protein